MCVPSNLAGETQKNAQSSSSSFFLFLYFPCVMVGVENLTCSSVVVNNV